VSHDFVVCGEGQCHMTL